MDKLPVDFKQIWCDALRGGKYPQGQSYLRIKCAHTIEWCCIGVACDLHDPTQWTRKNPAAATIGLLAYIDPYRYGIVADEIVRVLEQAIIPHNTVLNHLVHMNDETRNTFSEIADWVEENL